MDSEKKMMLPPEPGVPYPIWVGGKLQGPPEDCGGIPGYYDLLEAVRDPAREEHEEMLDWWRIRSRGILRR
ncbi:MAG: hypothetical protein ABSB82_19080 [Terriglobia bacterium]|jgi:hypothetical protein